MIKTKESIMRKRNQTQIISWIYLILYIMIVLGLLICLAKTSIQKKIDYDNFNRIYSALSKQYSDLQEATVEQENKINSLEQTLQDYQNSKDAIEQQASYGLFKSYMDYRVFDERWTPYQLQQKAYTDERGFRRIDDYYMIAIGTGWDVNVGEKVLVVLADGSSFKAIMGDTKSDNHTDPETHKVTVAPNPDGSVIEFIVDKNKIVKHIGNTGNIATLDEFKGAVIGIYKID